MTQNKKIYYWSPHLVNIATPRAVVNSAYSIQKYSTNFKPSIINFFGEFNNFKEKLNQKKINLINFYNHKIINFLPKHGFLQSRFSFIVLFILAFVPLKNLIKKNKPDFLIIHLITALPLFLLLFFNFETKFILRISGMPKINFIRKFLWKLVLPKIYCVTCPTKKTYYYIKSLKLVDEKKIKILYDPVINVGQLVKKKEINYTRYKNYYLAIGRLTYQKNFLFLIRCFNLFLKKNPNEKLLIAGEGEDRKLLQKFILTNNLSKNVILLGHVENIFPILRSAKAFILSSLWEDPGFVIIESAFCRVPIISSNCQSGPAELIKNNFNGYVFKSNCEVSFLKTIKTFNEVKNHNYIIKKSLKKIKKFTIFYHYRQLTELLR